jgi:O-antigen ligase
MASLVRLLLVLACGFAALSASVAAALGLEEERILAFSSVLGLLLLLPFLVRPRLCPPDGALLLLVLLAAVIVLADLVGRFDPLDARIVLPVLVLVAGPNLARFLPPEALTRFAWRLLAAYVAATFTYQVMAEPAVVARGYESIVRFDPTGSVVMHSSLSLILLMMAMVRLGGPLAPGARLATLALGTMALAMVFLTATRTAGLTLAIFALLHLVTTHRPARAMAQVAVAGVALAAAFAFWTLLVSDSFYLRLVGAQGEYSSGRWASIGHWLTLAADHPWGLGLGAVREQLAGGRPALDGTNLLEWPHNEFVRFYVEAGPLGLLFVVLLLALAVRRAVRTASSEIEPVRRALVLAIAADLVAEALLQNLLNAIYHATVLFLLLTLATTEVPPEAESEPPLPLADALSGR